MWLLDDGPSASESSALMSRRSARSARPITVVGTDRWTGSPVGVGTRSGGTKVDDVAGVDAVRHGAIVEHH